MVLNKIPVWLISVLQCPIDGGNIEYRQTNLCCMKCGEMFKENEGIIRMIKENALLSNSAAAQQTVYDNKANNKSFTDIYRLFISQYLYRTMLTYASLERIGIQKIGNNDVWVYVGGGGDAMHDIS